MKVVTAAEMRELDRRTIEEYGLPGGQLMETAGLGVAVHLQELIYDYGLEDGRILVVAGRGNNGGDAFVVAGALNQLQYNVELWMTCSPNELQGDALAQYQRMAESGVYIEELTTVEDWDNMDLPSEQFDLMVDGLLGTGVSGPARGVPARAIEFINERIEDALVVAIDIPSGLDADTGDAPGGAVIADVTITLAQPKQGLLRQQAVEYVGRVEVVDIGVPDEYVEQTRGEVAVEFISASDTMLMSPMRRARNSHKGDYGHVLLVGGSLGFSGAITMAARAALRSGAGLVTVYVPQDVHAIVAMAVPEAMVFPMPELPDATDQLMTDWRINDFDAVLVGPGLGRTAESSRLVSHLLKISRVPVVLDADAVAVMAGRAEEVAKAGCPVIITPHPGECSLLLDCSPADVQADRRKAALETASLTNSVTVLKGAGTIVAVPEGALAIAMTGNPGMAKGGSGDVLAGLLVGMIPQIPDVYSATCLAVYLHGCAGDFASMENSQMGMTAMDIVDQLPNVFHSLKAR
ncbi:NAD(P)H-hydrate dehydratase [Verrucomicrobiota bacterium]